MSEEQLNGNPEMELVVEPEVKEKKSKSEMKMEKLTIQDLPGVGAATAEKLICWI